MFMYNNKVVVTHSIEPALLSGEHFGKGHALNNEARLAQSVVVVTAIDTTVVVLPKEARALRRVGNRVILEGRGTTPILGYNHYAPPSRAHDAKQLAHSTAVILDMLKKVVADDNIY